MDKALVLRDWTGIDEVPELLDVWRKSVEGGRDFLSAADIDAAASALEAIYSQQVTVRIAELDGAVVGFTAWTAQRIELLWVRHQDRQHGIGGALLEVILQSAPGVGIQINGQNLKTLNFFLDHGFSVDAQEDPGPLARLSLHHVHIDDTHVAR